MSKDEFTAIDCITSFGIERCAGELFEAHGFCFCITNSIDSEIYQAIELSTGLPACERYVFDFIHQKACIDDIKQWIEGSGAMFAGDITQKGRALLAKNERGFPMNDKAKITK